MRSIDRAVDVGSANSSEVSDSNLDSHSNTSLGLSTQVVSKPGDHGRKGSVGSTGTEEQSKVLDSGGSG